jgi:hypothetical protein
MKIEEDRRLLASDAATRQYADGFWPSCMAALHRAYLIFLEGSRQLQDLSDIRWIFLGISSLRGAVVFLPCSVNLTSDPILITLVPASYKFK